MKRQGKLDLVPMGAIALGAALGAGSVWLLRDSGPSSVEVRPEAVQPTGRAEAPADWTSPTGPERGPTALEWQVIASYKRIESMTATDPSIEVVDQTLNELREFANDHPDNPYIQGLYLKGLRVARYYAVEGAHDDRALQLATRFTEHAARFAEYAEVQSEQSLLADQLGRSKR